MFTVPPIPPQSTPPSDSDCPTLFNKIWWLFFNALRDAVSSARSSSLPPNVKNFGAIGDGVSDDTASIRAAVASVSGAGGGALYFPAGTYKTSGVIKVPADVYIFGDGPEATVLWQATMTAMGAYTNTATPFDVVTITGGNSGIRDMTLRGSAGPSPAPAVWGGTYGSAAGQKGLCIQPASPSSFYLIENVTVEQCQTNCVQVWTGAAYATFNNVRFTDCGSEGLISFAQNTSIDGVYVARTGSWAIDANYGNFTLLNFAIDTCGSTTYFFDGGGVAVNIDPYWGWPAPANCTVAHGQIFNCTGVGITVSVARAVNTAISGILIDDVAIESTNRTQMNQGFNTTNAGGSALGSVQNAVFSNLRLTNCNLGLQNVQNIRLSKCIILNSLSLGGVDNYSTWGIDVDAAAGAPTNYSGGNVTVENCELAGWARGLRFQTCGGNARSLENTLHDNVLYGVDGAAVADFTSIGDVGYNNGTSDAVVTPANTRLFGLDGKEVTVSDLDITNGLYPRSANADLGRPTVPFRNVQALHFVIPSFPAGPYNAYYLGTGNSLGDWRITESGTAIIFQRQEGTVGTWVTKFTMYADANIRTDPAQAGESFQGSTWIGQNTPSTGLSLFGSYQPGFYVESGGGMRLVSAGGGGTPTDTIELLNGKANILLGAILAYLAGSGTQMLTVDNAGNVGAAALPSANSGPTAQSVANPWIGTPTGTRALNTVYQNTSTTKALFVMVTTSLGNSTSTASAVSDASATPTTQLLYFLGQADAPLSFWVLPGNYYKVNATGSYSLAKWAEQQ